MRAEDIVGCTFFAGVFAGLVLMLYGSRSTRGAKKSWVTAGLAIESLAFLTFGLLTFYFVRTSPRLQVEGNLWGAHRYQSRSGGSVFSVTADSGEVATVRCNYEGPGLREGDRVRVRYISYNGKLLNMTVLSGPYTGWELRESGAVWSGLMMAAVGLICGVIVLRRTGLQSGLRSTRSGAIN